MAVPARSADLAGGVGGGGAGAVYALTDDVSVGELGVVWGLASLREGRGGGRVHDGLSVVASARHYCG